MSFKSDYTAFLFWKVGVIFYTLRKSICWILTELHICESARFSPETDMQRTVSVHLRSRWELPRVHGGSRPLHWKSLHRFREILSFRLDRGLYVLIGMLCPQIPAPECCVLTGGKAECLPASRSLQWESYLPHGRMRKAQIYCRVCAVQTQLTEETLRPPWKLVLSWMQWRQKETRGWRSGLSVPCETYVN